MRAILPTIAPTIAVALLYASAAFAQQPAPPPEAAPAPPHEAAQTPQPAPPPEAAQPPQPAPPPEAAQAPPGEQQAPPGEQQETEGDRLRTDPAVVESQQPESTPQGTRPPNIQETETAKPDLQQALQTVRERPVDIQGRPIPPIEPGDPEEPLVD